MFLMYSVLCTLLQFELKMSLFFCSSYIYIFNYLFYNVLYVEILLTPSWLCCFSSSAFLKLNTVSSLSDVR